MGSKRLNAKDDRLPDVEDRPSERKEDDDDDDFEEENDERREDIEAEWRRLQWRGWEDWRLFVRAARKGIVAGIL